MNVKEIREAMSEARRFLDRAQKAIDVQGEEKHWDCEARKYLPSWPDGIPGMANVAGTPEAAAVRRSSMDLTRALASMRRR